MDYWSWPAKFTSRTQSSAFLGQPGSGKTTFSYMLTHCADPHLQQVHKQHLQYYSSKSIFFAGRNSTNFKFLSNFLEKYIIWKTMTFFLPFLPHLTKERRRVRKGKPLLLLIPKYLHHRATPQCCGLPQICSKVSVLSVFVCVLLTFIFYNSPEASVRVG